MKVKFVDDSLIPIRKIASDLNICLDLFYRIIRGEMSTVLAFSQPNAIHREAHIKKDELERFYELFEQYKIKVACEKSLKLLKRQRAKLRKKPNVKIELNVPAVLEKFYPKPIPKTIDIGLKPELKEAYLRNDSYWS